MQPSIYDPEAMITPLRVETEWVLAKGYRETCCAIHHHIPVMGTMIYKSFISEDALKNTTRCEKEFSCLSGDSECLCKVEYCVDDSVLFVGGRVNSTCRYQMSFGDRIICSCPIRKEIYKRWKI